MWKVNLFLLFLMYINHGHYYFAETEVKKVDCDFTVENNASCEQTLKAGNIYKYKCKYITADSTNVAISDVMDPCFSYVHKEGVEDGKEKTTNNITYGFTFFSFTKEDDATVTRIDIPDFIFEDMDFKCTCYMENSDKNKAPIQKTLTVHVKKDDTSSDAHVRGCNFRNLNTKNVFPNLQTFEKPKETHLCNAYGIQSSSVVAAFCPDDYTIEPVKFFTKVYSYKDNSKMYDDVIDEHDYTEVTMESFIHDHLNPIDISTGLAYAGMPDKLTKKFIFFGLCINSENNTKKRLNFFVNMTEEDARSMITNAGSNPESKGDQSVPLSPPVIPPTNLAPKEKPDATDQSQEKDKPEKKGTEGEKDKTEKKGEKEEEKKGKKEEEKKGEKEGEKESEKAKGAEPAEAEGPEEAEGLEEGEGEGSEEGEGEGEGADGLNEPKGPTHLEPPAEENESIDNPEKPNEFETPEETSSTEEIPLDPKGDPKNDPKSDPKNDPKSDPKSDPNETPPENEPEETDETAQNETNDSDETTEKEQQNDKTTSVNDKTEDVINTTHARTGSNFSLHTALSVITFFCVLFVYIL